MKPRNNLELEYRLRQQALLAELGRRALTELTLDVMLQEAARLTALGLATEFCKVLEYLPAENRLLVRAGVGWHEGVVGVATVGADLELPAGYALHTGKPVISNDLPMEDRFRTPGLLTQHGVTRAINVILIGEGKPFGVLEADSRSPGAFSEHDIDFLQGFANLLGVAIENKRAHEALRDINAQLEHRVADEVAERRRAEVALHQAQKMEAIGQLTGGVAHDFNNLLTVISGHLDLISAAVTTDENLSRLVSVAQRAAMRGGQLTGQLLAFARRQTLKPQTRPINELIGEFDVLAGRILSEAIEIRFDLTPAPGSCHVDPSQFGAMLLNLVVNARDAMPQGGTLSIKTMNVDLDMQQAGALPEGVPGSYIAVIVADTGTGMSPDVLTRATEPFFTTKDQGRGTGLGLSQVYGFVRQSGGFLGIESTPERGTTVTVYLPRREGTERPISHIPNTASATGSETILVVEDDEDVSSIVIESLDALGYEPLLARSAHEALELMKSRTGTLPQLVLTDVVMPGGMSGIELRNEIRQRWPTVKILLTSGYAAGGQLAQEGGAMTDVPVLSKPYRLAELGLAIRTALDS